MIPKLLIALPDLVFAGRLKSLVPEEMEADADFAGSLEDGLQFLHECDHLDLVVFGQNFPDGSGADLVAAVREKFPRARLAVMTDLPPEACAQLDPGWVVLNAPVDAGQFVALCREAMGSLHGRQLGHFVVDHRVRSDRWADWYRAYDITLKREVDLGVLHAWATEEESLRFRETASLRARAIHDHVQTVYFGGAQDGRDFVSHERWEMPGLPTLIEQGHRIDERVAARILHTVASVLMFWDANGYPHPPLALGDVTLSPYGVVKVKNIIDPAWPLRPMRVSDLVGVANAVYALLPSLEKIPRHLRELLNRIRASEQVVFETSLGNITVGLERAAAPVTVENFLSYVDRQAYDNTLVHHVIADFVVQGGRYTREMEKIPTDEPIPSEAANGLLNQRGTLAMAHGADPNSATSQFIFNVVNNKSLDRGPDRAGFAVFGKVVRGMEVVDDIARVEVLLQDHYYLPVNPVVLFKVRRTSSLTMEDVAAEAQAIDMQMNRGRGQSAMAGQDSSWLGAMASSNKTLASVSKVILTLSGSLKRKTGGLDRKD